jgi:hypothetical protein
MIVRPSRDHLWGEVVRGPAECTSDLALSQPGAPSKVSELSPATRKEEDILRLHIPVHYGMRVEVVQSARNIIKDPCGLGLWEALAPADSREELALRSELQEQVDVTAVLKVVEELYDIGVHQAPLRSHLLGHISLQLVLLDALARDSLQRENFARGPAAHLGHRAERS